MNVCAVPREFTHLRDVVITMPILMLEFCCRLISRCTESAAAAAAAEAAAAAAEQHANIFNRCATADTYILGRRTVLFWFTYFDEVPPLQKGNQMLPFLI